MARGWLVSSDVPGEQFLYFECPGCENYHGPRVAGTNVPIWSFNGNVDLPTLAPSLLTRREGGTPKVQHVCHSFVKDGQIQFLYDCTHKLAGKTIDLPTVVRAPWDSGGTQG